MNPKTLQLIERIRSSRAKPKFDASYFGALAEDVLALGKQGFVEEVQRLMAPSSKKSTNSTADHPLRSFFEVAQGRTRFATRRDFVDAIVDEAIQRHGPAFKLPSRKRTMPGLLNEYSARLTTEELKSLLVDVSSRHAYSRTA